MSFSARSIHPLDTKDDCWLFLRGEKKREKLQLNSLRHEEHARLTRPRNEIMEYACAGIRERIYLVFSFHFPYSLGWQGQRFSSRNNSFTADLCFERKMYTFLFLTLLLLPIFNAERPQTGSENHDDLAMRRSAAVSYLGKDFDFGVSRWSVRALL